MKTMEEKFREIHKGCDNIVDHLMNSPHGTYDQGRYALAKEILDLIEED